MKRILKSFAILVLILAGANCSSGDDPLLSALINNRMVVILKGTYATDRPLDFAQINNNTLFVDDDAPTTEVLDTGGVPAYNQLPIYLDIGEVRLSTKGYLSNLYDIDSDRDVEEFWDVVSTTRQVYCSQLYAAVAANDSCSDTGGLINYIEFFNGVGALYPSRDVGPGGYTHAGVFMRSFFTGFAKREGVVPIGRFDNNDVSGTDVLPLLNYDAGVDAAVKAALPPQWFPLHHITYPGQQDSMQVFNGYASLVLEVRTNIKENLMLHSFPDAQGEYFTIVGISDWRVEHTGQFDMGGNALTRARLFYPDYTGNVQVTGGTESTRHYYAIYYAHECIDQTGAVICNKDRDLLPLAATPVRNGGDNVMTELGPGQYVLQCRYDAVHDGYPEEVLSEIRFDLPLNTDISIACACGSSTTTGCN
ncbi:MAG: hypothetical protein CMN76_04250 [Spirochaetaceae bacterium]|nr:hypothetical protein [Spirochaetaceae bacterium]|tara:strand:- start:319164 stop:320426 length:1263 start_codon:yes stop_codon:yes gene_type:complete